MSDSFHTHRHRGTLCHRNRIRGRHGFGRGRRLGRRGGLASSGATSGLGFRMRLDGRIHWNCEFWYGSIQRKARILLGKSQLHVGKSIKSHIPHRKFPNFFDGLSMLKPSIPLAIPIPRASSPHQLLLRPPHLGPHQLQPHFPRQHLPPQNGRCNWCNWGRPWTFR